VTSAGQLGDGVTLDGETLGSGGADVLVAGTAESLVASPDGDGAGGGGVVLGGVVPGGAVLLGAGAGALLCGSLLVGAGAVGSGAAEEVAGEPVPDVEPLGCWLPAGLLPPEALAGAVLPVEVVPGALVPGDVVPGEVVPGALVPGDVVPGDVLSGDALPGALVPGVPSADVVPACGDAADWCWIRGRGSDGDSTGGGGDPSRIASPTGVIPVPGTPTGTGGSAAVAGPVATRTAPAYPLSHIVVTSTNSPGCGDCTILPSPR
jgi:hypothetical protein